MKAKAGFLTQGDISYMYLLAEKLKELSKNEEGLLQIDAEFYSSLKQDLVCSDKRPTNMIENKNDCDVHI